ncbi:MAG: class I SAM-dependent methyltransferase family protein [Candidatus Bathyarchaeia archaeon]
MKRRLRNILSNTLPDEEVAHICNSYDIIGDIAVIRLNEYSRKNAAIIAQTLMKIHRNVKTVLAQVSPVYGDFRIRKLERIAGENRTTTLHKESSCIFSVDVASCYFSPRLFYERLRVARQVKSGEIIVNMFAGVGCFSIVIAKHSKAERIYSIDINPEAFRYMCENIKLNKVYGRVIPLIGDAKEIVKSSLKHVADRVLLPLPEKAFEYIFYALLALRDLGGWIHHYDFEHAGKNEDPVKKVQAKVERKLEELNVDFETVFGRVVRSIGPNWYQVVLDIHVKKKPEII